MELLNVKTIPTRNWKENKDRRKLVKERD